MHYGKYIWNPSFFRKLGLKQREAPAGQDESQVPGKQREGLILAAVDECACKHTHLAIARENKETDGKDRKEDSYAV